MKRLIILLFLAALASGCAKLSPGTSYSAFGNEALTVARFIADRLSGEYPPARTTLYFMAQKGGMDEFTGLLEEVCMHAGFTVVREPKTGAVKVLYVLDMIQGSQPLQAYLYLETEQLALTRRFSPNDFALAANTTELLHE